MSTDPAHSLADAFDLPLGDDPREIAPKLHAQQVDTQTQLETFWSDIHEQLMAVFNWGGVNGIAAEEFLIFPGMDELFSLLEVKEHAKSGDYDVVVVDCAPTAETLRLLSLPEVLSWYFDRVLPTERKIMRAARPVLSRVTSLPMPSESVFDAAETVFAGVEEVRELLSDPQVTSARLVVNPEKMVVNEARRTYTYLGFFGYGVDGVVVNRVLPPTIKDPYFKRWRTIQQGHLDTIDEAFQEVDVLILRLFDEEMVGVDRLRQLAEELYADRHPIDGFTVASPFTVTETDDAVVLELSVPFVERDEVDVLRHGGELYVTVGAYRRSFVLPDSLRRRVVGRAKLEDGKLRVSFVESDK